ncbi:STAS domain-containing protein [Streptomyces kunmingensis]|uniref:STAS domain-containing protein n=1 Tax=Streptomyces kunmingensis TaxID=68225 RepID=A0ABU6CAT1_9ACTN|nr:STAS domain-containing protein [Streptomyces kunmingensis]MEB3961470.1 STAS domain-containing protein [Streptomyces kunmingensis]
MKVTGSLQRTVLHVAGELDIASVPEVEHEVHRLLAQADCVRLDLSRVTFCGAAGALWLTDALRHAACHGKLRIARAHSEVIRMLRLTGDPDALEVVRHCSPPADPRQRQADIAYLHDLLYVARHVSGAPMGNAQLYDAQRRSLSIVTHHGFHRLFLRYFETVELGDEQSGCGTAGADRTPVFVEESTSSPLFWHTSPARRPHRGRCGGSRLHPRRRARRPTDRRHLRPPRPATPLEPRPTTHTHPPGTSKPTHPPTNEAIPKLGGRPACWMRPRYVTTSVAGPPYRSRS